MDRLGFFFILGWWEKWREIFKSSKFKGIKETCVCSLQMNFEIFTTTQARSWKSFILYLYVNTNSPNQVRGHFACLVQREQQEIITKHQIYRQVIFKETFSLIQPS